VTEAENAKNACVQSLTNHNLNIEYTLRYSMSEQQNIQVANEILSQLKQSKVNGFPFLMYSGAKDFVAGENALLFKIPNKKLISAVKIVLDVGMDEYNLEFYKKKGFEMNVAKEIKGIYFDQLAEIIARELNIL